MLSSPHPKIVIVGAGAVGGYYGARLAQHGHEVYFLLRTDYETVRKQGWKIKSCDGDFNLPLGKFGASDDPTRLPKADLVIVTLKTTANDRFDSLIRPLIKNDTAILTLQNGLGNEERLAELFGKQHILGGMAFTCINRIAPGVIHHIAQGWIRIGEFNGGRSDRAAEIAHLFTSGGIDCGVLDSLRRGRWEKLAWNIPFNGLGAVLDWTTDRLIATEAGREMVSAVIEEVRAAAAALGIELRPDIAQVQIEKTAPMGPYLTSMQIDCREGRPMEIEAILGQPLRQGTAAGASMPRIRMIYELAKIVSGQ